MSKLGHRVIRLTHEALHDAVRTGMLSPPPENVPKDLVVVDARFKVGQDGAVLELLCTSREFTDEADFYARPIFLGGACGLDFDKSPRLQIRGTYAGRTVTPCQA